MSIKLSEVVTDKLSNKLKFSEEEIGVRYVSDGSGLIGLIRFCDDRVLAMESGRADVFYASDPKFFNSILEFFSN